MCLLQLWNDTNGGLVHWQRKGNSRIIMHTHWSGWIVIVVHVVVIDPECADCGCSSAGCSTATWCVSTTMETCWMLVSLPCWLPWRTVCAVKTLVAIDFTVTEKTKTHTHNYLSVSQYRSVSCTCHVVLVFCFAQDCPAHYYYWIISSLGRKEIDQLCNLLFIINILTSWVALLPTAQLPEVTISTETGTPGVNLEKRHGLHIHKHPVGASFCVFDKWVNDFLVCPSRIKICFLCLLVWSFVILVCSPCSSILIVDPTAEEESLSTAQLTVVTDEEGRLCAVHKPGQKHSL